MEIKGSADWLHRSSHVLKWSVIKLLCELSDVFQLRCEMEAEKQRALQELEEQMRLELQELTDKHKQAISEIKKKQWVCILLTYMLSLLKCDC